MLVCSKGCGEEPQGRLGNLRHISCLCTLQRLVSVLTVDLVQKEARFGTVSDVQVGIQVCSRPALLGRVVCWAWRSHSSLAERLLHSNTENWKTFPSLPPSLHTMTAMGLCLGPCPCWMNVLMLRHVFIPKALPLCFLETNHSSSPPQTRSAVVQPSLELICSQL